MAEDNSSPPCSRDTQITILDYRITALNDALNEIKGIIKRIEESVGVIRLLQLSSDQNTSDYNTLSSTVRDLNDSLTRQEDEMYAEVAKAKSDMRTQIDELDRITSSNESKWKEKYNTLRGIVLALSFVATLLGGAAVWFAKSATDMVNSSYTYVLQLKTLDAIEILKNSLRDKR